jgi:hypothetical protein
MKIKKLLLLAVFQIIVFTACQEKNPINLDEHSEIINDYPVISFAKVLDGRLVFENKEKFDEAINILLNHQEQLNGFENQFFGFESSQMAFEKLIEDLENN